MEMDPMNPDADFDLPDLGDVDPPDLGGFDDPLDPVDNPLDPLDPLDDPLDPLDDAADPADPADPADDPIEPGDDAIDDPADDDPADDDPADPAGPAADPVVELPVDDDPAGDPVDGDPVVVDPIDDPQDPVDELDPTWAEFLASHNLDPAEFEGDSLQEIVAELEAHGIEVEPVEGHEHLLELVDQGHRILVVVIDPDDGAIDPPAVVDPQPPGQPDAAGPAGPADPAATPGDPETPGEISDLPADPGGPGGLLADVVLDGDLPDLGVPDGIDSTFDGGMPGDVDPVPEGLDPSILEAVPSADGTSLEIETPDGMTSVPLPEIDPASFLKASAGSAGGLLDDGNIVLGAAGVILIAGGAIGLRRSRR